MRTSKMTNITSISEIPASSSNLAVLERRLDDGYERIEQAIARGESVSHWEDFWLDLLHQYEAACVQYDEAA